MTDSEIRRLSTLGLAHVGDGVYELLARTHLCEKGISAVAALHRESVRMVNARAQAAAAARIRASLTEAEAGVFRRGRNAQVHAVPKGAGTAEYHAATGLEALFGWLYLRGERERLEELFRMITEERDAP